MADYRTIPAAELGKGSNIKVELCETEVDLYWKMAIEVLELIQENNAKGEKTVMIVPYGPLGPYARLVELINKHRVSLKNCWFIWMRTSSICPRPTRCLSAAAWTGSSTVW